MISPIVKLILLSTVLTVINCDPLPSSSSSSSPSTSQSTASSSSSKSKISTDLVLDAFELFRRLLQESSVVQSEIVTGKTEKDSTDHTVSHHHHHPHNVHSSSSSSSSSPSVSTPVQSSNAPSHYSPLLRLDPLVLTNPIVHEVRDVKSPTLGKIVLTLDNVQFTGFSDFKVEQISNAGPCLNFQHLIPKLNTCANYTVDYYLFDSIPLRISEGAVKATIPKAKIVGRFFAFASVIGDWSRTSQFNLTTTVDEEVALMVSPLYTISDRFVLDSSMGQFDSAIRSSLPEVSEALRNAYSKVIEMKLSD